MDSAMNKRCETCIWWTWIGYRYACCLGCCNDYERWENNDRSDRQTGGD